MQRRALALGFALIAIGVGSFLGTGGASYTALIPAAIGVPLLVAATFRRPMLALIVAGLGLLGSMRGLADLPALLSGAELERPLAVSMQSAMALLCAAFLVVNLLARAGRTQLSDSPQAGPARGV